MDSPLFTSHLPKNVLVILNPHSGNGTSEQALKKLEVVAADRGSHLEVLRTRSAGHAVTFLKEHTLKDLDAILSIGGDGTLNEVVNGLLMRKDRPDLPIGIIPCGTGNSLMKDLNCPDVEKALQDIYSGKRSRLDVFRVEVDGIVQYGFNMVGCGLPASINEYAEALRFFKKQRYNVGALKAILTYKRTGYILRNETSGVEYTSDFIIASNTRHIASGLKIAPGAQLEDGWLDVVFLKPFSRLSLIPLFYKLLRGNHERDEKVMVEKMKQFSVNAPSRKMLNIDGEQHEFNELHLSVLKQPIEILHPPDRGTASS